MAVLPTNNYVKFIKGTPAAYAALAVKNDDTLYFVSNPDDTSGLLYLGSKLIGDGNTGSGSAGATSLSELTDILISAVADKQLLTYDAASGKWVNTAISALVPAMQGATAEAPGVAGLVPAPPAGANTKFLRGDGTWVTLDIDGDVANGVLDEVETRLNNLLSRVEELDPTDLTGRVTVLEATVGTLSSSIETINGNISDLSDRMETVEESVKWSTLTTD